MINISERELMEIMADESNEEEKGLPTEEVVEESSKPMSSDVVI